MNIYEARKVIESCAVQVRVVCKTFRSKALHPINNTAFNCALSDATASLLKAEALLAAACIASSPRIPRRKGSP